MGVSIRGLRKQLTLAAALLCALPSSVRAESYTGEARGRVLDAGGRAIHSSVELIDWNKQTARSSTTNEQGEFAFVELAPGTSPCESTPDLSSVVIPEVRIGVRSSLTIPDIVMGVRAAGEEVTVVAKAPVLEQSSTSAGVLIGRAAFETLPTAGRTHSSSP